MKTQPKAFEEIDGRQFLSKPKVMLCAIIATSIFFLALQYWKNREPVHLTFLGYTNLDMPFYAYNNSRVAVFTIKLPHEHLRKRFRTSGDETTQFRRTKASNEWADSGFFGRPLPYEMYENGFRTIYIPAEGISNVWRIDETNQLSFPVSFMGKTFWTLKFYTPMTTGPIEPPAEVSSQSNRFSGQFLER